MSFISSGRKSSTPSILRKPGRPRSLPANSVKFKLDSGLKTLLLSYVNEKNRDAYVELIHRIKDAGDKITVTFYFCCNDVTVNRSLLILHPFPFISG